LGKYLPLRDIITDGASFYPEIIVDLGAMHQICSFHKVQNLMILQYKITNRNKLKIKKREEKKEKLKIKINNLKIKQGSVPIIKCLKMIMKEVK
jgi:hypothetical protein